MKTFGKKMIDLFIYSLLFYSCMVNASNSDESMNSNKIQVINKNVQNIFPLPKPALELLLLNFLTLQDIGKLHLTSKLLHLMHYDRKKALKYVYIMDMISCLYTDIIPWIKHENAFMLTKNENELFISNAAACVNNLFTTYSLLKKNGNIKTWGFLKINTHNVTTKFKKIYKNSQSLVALDENGNVTAWGNSEYGGDISGVQHLLHGVKEIFTTDSAYAALKNDETIVTWGEDGRGGDSSSVQHLLHNIKKVVATRGAFGVLKYDGTVATWGCEEEGYYPDAVELSDVIEICATRLFFVALTKTGFLLSAGYNQPFIQAKVSKLICTNWGFAALKNTNSLRIWRNLQNEPISEKNVKKIISTSKTMAILKKDGLLLFYNSWGFTRNGPTFMDVEIFSIEENEFLVTFLNGTQTIMQI